MGSQNSWIMSRSIKENILFHLPYDETKFQTAIYYSGFKADLDELKDKEETIMGDKGINLSGGQKTRLSLARNIYSNADIMIMDDPISALDINVGKFVMEECILNHLKDKTRVIT